MFQVLEGRQILRQRGLKMSMIRNIWNSRYLAPLTEPWKMIGRVFAKTMNCDLGSGGYYDNAIKKYKAERKNGSGIMTALAKSWPDLIDPDRAWSLCSVILGGAGCLAGAIGFGIAGMWGAVAGLPLAFIAAPVVFPLIPATIVATACAAPCAVFGAFRGIEKVCRSPKPEAAPLPVAAVTHPQMDIIAALDGYSPDQRQSVMVEWQKRHAGDFTTAAERMRTKAADTAMEVANPVAVRATPVPFRKKPRSIA